MSITFLEKKPGQRACSQKDEKGELCVGHLKRWYQAPAEVVSAAGHDAQVFRCERCHALYLPSAKDTSSAGLQYEVRPVNLLGGFMRHGGK